MVAGLHWCIYVSPSLTELTGIIPLVMAYRYYSTHRGRVTHICVKKLTVTGSDNGLSPGRRQAILWTGDGILLIRTLITSFSDILSEIHTFSFKKMHLKMSSAKWRPFCIGLNVLKLNQNWSHTINVKAPGQTCLSHENNSDAKFNSASSWRIYTSMN